MNARDELARDLFLADNSSFPEGVAEKDWDENREHHDYAYAIADGLITRGYRRARTITMAEELKTVYEGAIPRDCHGDLWGIDGKSGRLFSVQDGADELYDDDELDLPATVVYEEQP